MNENKYAVWIGRFQPFHVGHERILNKIREEFNNVIIILGTPQIGDRFSFEDRKIFLNFLCTEMQFTKFYILTHQDHEDDHKWAYEIVKLFNWFILKNSVLIKSIKKKDINEDGKHYLDFLTDNGYFKESVAYIVEDELSAKDIRKDPVKNIDSVHPYLRKMFLNKYVKRNQYVEHHRSLFR